MTGGDGTEKLLTMVSGPILEYLETYFPGSGKQPGVDRRFKK
jgi:hypothetical protein